MSMKCLFGHKWNGCKCVKCGAIRDEGHKWILLDNECVEKCSICGKERNVEHRWNCCKCEKCGATRDEGHLWNGYKCERCGKTNDSLVIQAFAQKLLKAVQNRDEKTVTEIGHELFELGRGGNRVRKIVAQQIGELNASYLGGLGYFKQY